MNTILQRTWLRDKRKNVYVFISAPEDTQAPPKARDSDKFRKDLRSDSRRSLYSSVVERQSCKLKVLGSIPNGGSLIPSSSSIGHELDDLPSFSIEESQITCAAIWSSALQVVDRFLSSCREQALILPEPAKPQTWTG